MFFIISKVLGFFALPSNIIVVLGLFGVLLIGGRLTQLGLRLAAASVLLIAVCALGPGAWFARWHCRAGRRVRECRLGRARRGGPQRRGGADDKRGLPGK